MQVLYALDDGTGLMQCTLFLFHEDGGERELAAPPQLGDLVRVRGSLSRYMGATEVKAVAVTVLRDPNSEAS